MVPTSHWSATVKMISDPIHLLSNDHECLIPEKPSGVDRFTAEYCEWKWAYHGQVPTLIPLLTMYTTVVSVQSVHYGRWEWYGRRKKNFKLAVSDSICKYKAGAGLFLFASFNRCQTYASTVRSIVESNLPLFYSYVFTTEYSVLTHCHLTRPIIQPDGSTTEYKWY